jgi:hypothetical protein
MGVVANIAGSQYRAPARLRDPSACLACVLMLVEVGDQDIGAFAREGDRYRPSYS